jgi:hypothetical protein
MWGMRTIARPSADALALEAHVARAGLALACAYSSSAEYEAELIATRRAAGAYGGKRQRHVLYAAAAATLALILLAAAF